MNASDFGHPFDFSFRATTWLIFLVLTTTGWIAMKFGRDIQGTQAMNP